MKKNGVNVLLNRSFQKSILEYLAKVYPESKMGDIWSRLYNEISLENGGPNDSTPCPDHTKKEISVNFEYLTEHGLIQEKYLETTYAWKITAKGLDFLEDDGGLSAILNTVTVKFDMNNIRDLVESGLLQVDLPEEKKNALKEALRKAPSTVFQKLTDKLLERAVSDPMALVRTLGEVLDKAI